MTKSELSMMFGCEVRRRREAKDLTLEELADRSGLTPSFIDTVETGSLDLTLSSVLAISDGLGTDLIELFGPVPGVSVAAKETAHLFDAAPLAIQSSVLTILRSIFKRHSS
jgi:transcriptional regulator with XRE-family HTH domain